MVEGAKSWVKENHTLVMFLLAQFLAIGAGAASILAYAVKLETQVTTMEVRGAAYTVARMDEMKLKINSLETRIERNEDTLKRVVDVMTRELGKPVPRP